MAVTAVASLSACAATDSAEELSGAHDGSLEAEQGIGSHQLACSTPIDLDPARSLMVTDPQVLSRFPLQAVFNQLLALANVTGPTALGLYQRWWDSQNTSAGGVFPDAIHCDDELDANGAPAINGFPIQCPRNEGALALSNPFLDLPLNLAFMKPLAIVNRFDLAPLDGSHCGEYRIIYGKRSGETLPIDRNLIILEAQLPNPNPECGLAACSPVAEFWANLTSVGSSTARADALEDFYFDGLPGFAPVIHPDHYAEGTGQFRTNQFMPGLSQQIWQLREFRLARVCDAQGASCQLVVKPVTVKDNPFGALFDVNFADTRTAGFQASFLSQVASLAPQDVNAMRMSIPDLFNAGQSNSQATENEYAFHLSQGGANNAFIQALDAQLASLGRSDLTAANIADRATAQSCGGCHELSSGDNLGGAGGAQWPAHTAPGAFVHVDENSQLSAPLTQVFLPRREQILLDFLAQNDCATCSQSRALAAGGPSAGKRTLGGSTTH